MLSEEIAVLGVAEPSRGVACAVELRSQSSEKSADWKTNESRLQLSLFGSILIHKRCLLEKGVRGKQNCAVEFTNQT